MKYKLISYKSERLEKECWTLLDLSTGLTPMYSMIYSALILNKKASSTQRRYMTVIIMFYEYIYQKHNEVFDFFFEFKGLRGVISELDGFSSYLESGRKGTNVQYLNSSEIKLVTSRIRIGDLFKFLTYLSERYVTVKYDSSFTAKTASYEQNSIRLLLKSKKEELTSTSSKRQNKSLLNDYKSLTPFQSSALLKVIRPSTEIKPNELNPFSGIRNSFRNYLLIILALEYGLRRGEINLLETDSFKPSLHSVDGVINYYIVVTNCEDENEFVEGSIKTDNSHRTLQITKEYYDLLCAYVNNFRLKENEKSSSSILFLSTQLAKPLTLRMINKIFEILTKALHKHFPEIADNKSMEYLASCYPHCLRHTWAVSQLSHMVDVKGMELESAKDLLRGIGGWSINSKMPDHYGRRFVQDKANASNLNLILNRKSDASN